MESELWGFWIPTLCYEYILSIMDDGIEQLRYLHILERMLLSDLQILHAFV